MCATFIGTGSLTNGCPKDESTKRTPLNALVIDSNIPTLTKI